VMVTVSIRPARRAARSSWRLRRRARSSIGISATPSLTVKSIVDRRQRHIKTARRYPFAASAFRYVPIFVADVNLARVDAVGADNRDIHHSVAASDARRYCPGITVCFTPMLAEFEGG